MNIQATTGTREQFEESIRLSEAMITELLERWEKAPTSTNANALHQIREGLALTEAKHLGETVDGRAA